MVATAKLRKLLDVRPNRMSYEASIRMLRNAPTSERATLARVINEAVSTWPAETRALSLPRQTDDLRNNPGLVESVGRLEIARLSSTFELPVRLLSRLRWKNLQQLGLWLFPGPPADLVPILSVLPESVTGLWLDGSAAGFSDLPATVSHPRFLRLRDLGVSCTMLRTALSRAADLPPLEGLYLGGEYWTPAELATLLRRPEVAGLQRLELRTFVPDDGGKRELADAVSRLTALSSIGFDRQWASTPGHAWVTVSDLVTEIFALPRLEHLRYSRGATSSAMLRGLLSTSSRLQSFAVYRDVLVDDLAWTHALALQSLESLSVCDAPLVGDDAARELADAELEQLRQLELRKNDIGPTGAARILERLANQLDALDLSDNPASDVIVDELVHREAFIEHVVSLKLERCGFTARSSRQLLERLEQQAERLAVLRIVDGNEVDSACSELLDRLQRRGVDVGDTKPPGRSGPRVRTFRPSVTARRERDAEGTVAAWSIIDRWVSKNVPAEAIDFAPPADTDPTSALAPLLSRLHSVGLRVPESLVASWRVHDGGRMMLFDAWGRASGLDWYSAEQAARSCIDMIDIGVDWPPHWLPVGGGGGWTLFVDLRTGELRGWDRGESWSFDTDWHGLVMQVAEAMQSGRVAYDDDEMQLVRVEPHAGAAPEAPSVSAGTRLLQALVDAGSIELAAAADRDTLAAALDDALAVEDVAVARAALTEILERHPSIEECFLDDEMIERVVEEFR